MTTISSRLRSSAFPISLARTSSTCPDLLTLDTANRSNTAMASSSGAGSSPSFSPSGTNVPPRFNKRGTSTSLRMARHRCGSNVPVESNQAPLASGWSSKCSKMV